MGLRIVVGADPAATGLMAQVVEELGSNERVQDVLEVEPSQADGTAKDHRQVAIEVAEAIADGTADRGLAFCGNGLGVAIAANSIEGVSAVTAHDIFSVRTSVTGNRAQVLCMGARVIAPEHARMLVNEWLGVEMPVD